MPDLWYKVDTPFTPFAVLRKCPLQSGAQVPCCQFDCSVSHGTKDIPTASRCPTFCQLECSVSEDIPTSAIALSDYCQLEPSVSHNNSTLKCWMQVHCLRAPALTVPGSVCCLSPFVVHPHWLTKALSHVVERVLLRHSPCHSFG